MLDGLRLAFGTLTALPVPPPTRVDRRVAGHGMLLAPFAVLPFAALTAGMAWAGRAIGVSAPVTACLVVAVLVLGTRAMHLDGLADTADGLSASYDRDRALEVMRRGDVGPSGVAAVALVLLLDAAAVSAVVQTGAGPLLVALAVLLSRHGLSWACVRGVPAARPEGLGATVAGSVARPALALVSVLLLALAVVGASAAGRPWWVGAAIWGAVVLTAAAVVVRANRRLGGITGDVLGATVEIGFAACVTVAAVVAAG
jgi:adenosylcobinamide-GDP ribazoletransferase